MDVADTWRVVVGYAFTEYQKNYGTFGGLFDLSTLVNLSCVRITNETSFLIPSNVVPYNELYELSVASRGQKVLIGIHRLASAVILDHHRSSLNVSRTHMLTFISSSSVARVADWVNDTTIALLVQDPYETSWSTTQIFFYHENSITFTSPLFTFPDNQQILGSCFLSRPSFTRFSITTGGNMAVLTGNADVLIIPLASTGYASPWIDTMERTYVFYYESKVCIGGTYKNRSSLGPCQICPSGTRNPRTSADGILQCTSYSNTSMSFCSLASLADIDLTTVSSYSQALAYPETADATDIEDILIKNIFQISTDSHCLMISPLLWTVVVDDVCILFWIFIVTSHLCEYESCMKFSKRAKKIFKHTDIIGEGEMWTDELATLAIVVLVSFSYWFSASFIKRYSIENLVQPANFACDTSLVNAKFSAGLELLAIPKFQSAQPLQETATTFVTFSLPRHWTTVQLNMSGPYWIGAIRLCLRGYGTVNASNTLRELDFCEYYATPNQAIGRYTYIPIVFVKSINMTQSLNPANSTMYSGVWMPTFTTVSLSDEDYYVEFGNYLRYTSSLTVLQVSFGERPFYIKNIQQPIVRTAELIFHGLLFTSLCIELFAFSFLFIKLFLIPVCRSVGRLWNRIRSRDSKLDTPRVLSVTLLRFKSLKNTDYIWKVEANSLSSLTCDSSVSNHMQASNE